MNIFHFFNDLQDLQSKVQFPLYCFPRCLPVDGTIARMIKQI